MNVIDTGTAINNGEDYSGGKYHYFNNSDGVVQRTLNRYKTYTLAFSTQTSHNKGNLVSLEVKQYGATEWERIFSDIMTAGQQNTTITFDNTVFASSLADYRLMIRTVDGVKVPYIWGFRLYEEVEVEVPIEGENTGAISSQITQLYNMINLSILGKDGAMSRLAMGEEGIQIDGKLLHITAKTYIDEAVIKSAMIDTLDASKITTGELNASLIRVVNLDASSITGNEANFIRAMFSGAYSTLQITGNGINILDNAGRTATHFDNRGIEFYEEGTKLGNLEYVRNASDSGAYYGFNGISFRPERDSYFGVSYFPAGSSTSIRRFSVSGNTGRVYMQNLYPSEHSNHGLEFVRFTLSGESGTVVRNTANNSGIFFGDYGRLSFLENGTWTPSPV